MLHTIALGAAIVSLGLLSAIYFCNFMSRPTSALRSEVVSMILIALLTGIFTLAVTATLVGFWFSLSGGVSMAALLGAGTDIAAAAVVVACGLVFRAIVRRTYRTDSASATVTPLTPRPVNANGAPTRRRRMAA